MMNRQVGKSSDLGRILSLPRRQLAELPVDEYKRMLNAIYSYGGEGVGLLDPQAIALTEMRSQGGACCPIQVGGGKTLVTFLAPYALNSVRPILLLPAGLKDRTQDELLVYGRDWKIPRFIRIETYQRLGRVDGILEAYAPDLIICDEAHYLKDPNSECTFQVERFMSDNPATRMVALSGTITKRSLKDFAHILEWCLGKGSPLPLERGPLLEWAAAVDEKVNPMNRVQPGYLYSLLNEEEKQAYTAHPMVAARSGIRRRLCETPGYVATNKAGIPGCELRVSTVEVKTNANTEWAMLMLRQEEVLPDGHQITDSASLWRHAREIAVGFYRIWDPRPPDWWLDPRQDFARACRETTKYSKTYRKEGQIKQALRRGDLPLLQNVWNAWQQVEERFVPNPSSVWLDDSVIDFCIEWGRTHKGIIWTEQTPFAMRLALKSGMPYYGQKGLDVKSQRQIESERGDRSVIASIKANGTGRNLQYAFDECLYTSMLPSGMWIEQSLGRFHRNGHKSDHVNAEVIVASVEHVLALDQAIVDCTYYKQTQGVDQKILMVSHDKLLTLEDVQHRPGPLWDKSQSQQGMIDNE